MKERGASPEAYFVEQEKPPQEACGIVAAYFTYPSSDGMARLVSAGEALQHRGPHGAGLAISSALGFYRHAASGGVMEALPLHIIGEAQEQMKAHAWAVLQTRYGTSGDYEETNLQPAVVKTKNGDSITVVHNGEFVATDKLREMLPAEIKKIIPQGASDSVIFSHFLASLEIEDPDERIKYALSQVTGAYSIAIGMNDALYVSKGELNIRPLCYGTDQDGNFMVASETIAFDRINGTVDGELRRGELRRIDQLGEDTLIPGEDDAGFPCGLERVYFAHRNSRVPLYTKENDVEYPERWRENAQISYESGIRFTESLPNESPLRDAHMVIGIPASGIPFAHGVATGLEIPCTNKLITKVKESRSFLDSDLSNIAAHVNEKLQINFPEKWKGKKVIIADDSIVRGNTFGEITRILHDLGVSEIHFASGFPPLRHPCHLGVSIRDSGELIAGGMVGEKQIAQKIKEIAGVPPDFKVTVSYLQQEQLMEATGGHDLCFGCVDGHYPVNKDGTPPIPYQARPVDIFIGNKVVN